MAARLALRAPVVVQPVEETDEADAVEEASESAAESEAPVGPSADEENSFLVGDMGEPDFGRSAVLSSATEEESEPAGELPALSALNRRIPAKALEAMDELFRAKFTKVERIAARHLKKS